MLQRIRTALAGGGLAVELEVETSKLRACVTLRCSAAAYPSVRDALARIGFIPVRAEAGGRVKLVTYDAPDDCWWTIDPIVGGRPVDRAGPRAHGITVALLGPDGVGKSTLIRNLADSFGIPVRTFYAGLYPTDRVRHRVPGGDTAAVVLSLWRMAVAAAYHRARGRVVLFDRYPFDALLPLSSTARTRSRWRRSLLARSCPAPDMTIVLDAPAEVLVGRRQEQPIDVVEAQRRRYAELAASLPGGSRVDSQGGIETVRREATELIWRRYASRATHTRIGE